MIPAFVVIWRYEVNTENVAAFERAYGPDGEWTALFGTSPDFMGTDLLRGEDGAFVTIDRWSSARAYDDFLATHEVDYRRIDEACDRLTTSERLVGRFVTTRASTTPCTLRAVVGVDLPIFFEHQRDPEAARVAAFPSRGREAFMAHWRERVLGDAANLARTVLVEGKVVGNVVSWTHDGRRLVGYWIGREHWGRGIATGALRSYLRCEATRPLHAWVAETNAASIRVLEKCGFVRCGEPRPGDDGVEVSLFELA